MVSESTVRMDRMSNRTVKDGRNQVIKGSEKTFLVSRPRAKKINYILEAPKQSDASIMIDSLTINSDLTPQKLYLSENIS